jgi:hypothetical protein
MQYQSQQATYKLVFCFNGKKLEVITRTWLQRRLSSCANFDSTQPELARCLGFMSPISVINLVSTTHQLGIPFQFGVHNLTFSNFDDGIPIWDTYIQTFGSAEIWHEIADPIFGHPILTYAFFRFYKEIP